MSLSKNPRGETNLKLKPRQTILTKTIHKTRRQAGGFIHVRFKALKRHQNADPRRPSTRTKDSSPRRSSQPSGDGLQRASLFLVVRLGAPFVASLFLVAMPLVPSSVLARVLLRDLSCFLQSPREQGLRARGFGAVP